MKAAVLLSAANIEIQELPPPEPAPGDVLIQPIRAGICGSDVSLFLGHRPAPYPLVLGHELVGRVAVVAEDVSKVQVGQRVVVEPNYPCGACRFCRAGRGSICPHKQSMGVTVPGCFADCVAAPAEFVWPLPDAISDPDAATIEPLTVALHAVSQSNVVMGDTVAVVGCGVIGLLLIHVAVRQGVRVLAHDKLSTKLESARRLGATAAGVEDLKELWDAANVTAVFECAGASATVDLSIRNAPRGSRVLLLGLATSPATFVPFNLVRQGISIEPSLIYDHPVDFARSISLVANGTLQPSIIVSDTFQFDSIGRALELASNGGAGKIHTIIA
jgi:2-desacetyl-2-hydroxyethyl bacteriochlorophyllide A dehydrogenase